MEPPKKVILNGPNTARGQAQTLIPEETMNMTQGYASNNKFGT